MKRRSIVSALCFLIAVLLICIPYAFAGSEEISAKFKSGNYVQKADNFLILFDKSGSMNDWIGALQKFEHEKILVDRFNRTVPDLKLNAGLRDFGENFADFAVTKLDYGIVAYNREALGKVVAGLKTPFGRTPLNSAIEAAGKDLQNVQGKIALVIFTDGEEVDEAASVAAANAVKKQFGDRICIYTVQLGKNPNGAKLLDRIAKAGQCGIYANSDSLASDAGMTGFVESIFLAAKPPAPPAPAPAPAAPPQEQVKKAPPAAAAPAPRKVTISLNVQFDTGKAIIKPKYYPEIDKVADFMKQYPDTKATIEGHTDNVGKAAANVRLSQQRANAVVKYLVTKSKIDKSRLKAVGYGPKKPIADNATAEGKQQNRRVEAQLETMVK